MYICMYVYVCVYIYIYTVTIHTHRDINTDAMTAQAGAKSTARSLSWTLGSPTPPAVTTMRSEMCSASTRPPMTSISMENPWKIHGKSQQMDTLWMKLRVYG